MLYSVHVYVISLVFMNCFRVFAISVEMETLCVCRTDSGGRAETSTQEAGGLGGSGQLGEGPWRPPVGAVGKATPLASEGRGESKRTRDSWLSQKILSSEMGHLDRDRGGEGAG